MPANKYISRINKDGYDLIIKDFEARDSIQYKDVYIGTGDTASEVMVNANHYSQIQKYTPIGISASAEYLWIIMPSAYVPVMMLNGNEIPITLDGTVAVGDVTYKVWKSNNSYTGTFNVFLF